MGSKNGVFVNGCPITERALVDGDQVRIGDSALVVLLPASPAPVEPVDSSVTIVERQPITSTTISMEGARRRYFGAPPAVVTPRATRDLALLFRLSDALQSVTAVETLYEVLLQHGLEAADTRGASILTTSPGDDTLAVVMSKSAPGEPVALCRAIAERAILEHAAISSGDDTPTCASRSWVRTRREVPCA